MASGGRRVRTVDEPGVVRRGDHPAPGAGRPASRVRASGPRDRAGERCARRARRLRRCVSRRAAAPPPAPARAGSRARGRGRSHAAYPARERHPGPEDRPARGGRAAPGPRPVAGPHRADRGLRRERAGRGHGRDRLGRAASRHRADGLRRAPRRVCDRGRCRPLLRTGVHGHEGPVPGGRDRARPSSGRRLAVDHRPVSDARPRARSRLARAPARARPLRTPLDRHLARP